MIGAPNYARADAPWCPVIAPERIAVAIRNGTMAHTALGISRRCPRCGEWYPYDSEFWMSHLGRGYGLHCWCKGCHVEARRLRREGMNDVGHED